MATMSLEERVALLEKTVRSQEQFIARLKSAVGGGVDPNVATERELDSQWGDPQVKLIPRTWTSGGVVKGQKYSTCPPDFLDLMAEMMDFFAERNDSKGEKDSQGRPKSYYDRKNARFARGWAKRIRNGWVPPEGPTFGSSNAIGSPDAGSNPFAQSASGTGAGSNPFAGGSSGFGGAASPPAAAPPTAPTSSPTSEDEDDELLEDNDISFPFGANARGAKASADESDEEELPLT